MFSIITSSFPDNLQLLWPDGAPAAQGDDDADKPALTPYFPDDAIATGASIVVCPGGGYGHLAAHEGEPVARWLNTLGVAVFVLRYRLGPRYAHPVMLHDAARALRLVRAQAEAWNLDAQRVGMLGFSAGGHLASTLATHFDAGDANADDPIERVSSRPDVAVLIYPVITLQEPFTHAGSRRNLLGESPDARMVVQFSNHLQVTPQTPPTFLVHSADDKGVPPENSLFFALALSAAKVPFELHLYEKGGHGYGLAAEDSLLGTWPERCAQWLRSRGF